MLKYLIILLISCGACSGAHPSNIPPDKQYKKDLKIEYNNNVFDGVAVLPKALSYKIEFKAKNDAKIMRISNCHRDVIKNIDDDKFEFSYTPNPLLERGSCVLLVSFLEKKTRHQFGLVDFIDDEALLATTHCNGEKKQYFGVSVCQAKAGTMLAISFEENTFVKSRSSCLQPIFVDVKTYKIKAQPGLCLYVFKSVKNEYHRLTVFGYNDFSHISE